MSYVELRNQRNKKGKGFVIYYLLFTIDYFSLASVLSVAQTTVLIGVNPCLYRRRFEKTNRAPSEADAIQQV